jgi:hypothetical protein
MLRFGRGRLMVQSPDMTLSHTLWSFPKSLKTVAMMRVEPMKHDLGNFNGHNKPSDIMSANRAANWRDFTALLIFANLALLVLAVWGWR